MSKFYHFTKHERRRCTLRVHFLEEGWAQVHDYNYMIEDELTKMVKWCEQNSCGRRTAYDMFAFRTLKEMSMFLLRWS